MNRDGHENIKNAEVALSKAGLKFDSVNHGQRFILYFEGRSIDFWPLTGDWRVHGGKTNRGLQKFLDYVAMRQARAS